MRVIPFSFPQEEVMGTVCPLFYMFDNVCLLPLAVNCRLGGCTVLGPHVFPMRALQAFSSLPSDFK